VVHGDQASIVKQKPDVQEDQLRAGMVPGSADWGFDPDDAVLYDARAASATAIKSARGDQRGFYVALRETLHGKGPNPVSPAQAATVMAIIDAAFRSHKEGRRVVPDLSDDERGAWAR
jgi:predicted dehydrogenase